MSDATTLCDIGLIGLGVMGKNIGLNLADNGYKVAAFDLNEKSVQAIAHQDETERGAQQDARILPVKSLGEMLEKIKKPSIIILSVPAGKPVDIICSQLLELGLQQDDIVVDTGNSLWTDTVEREAGYNGKFVFFSCAVSGGEVGARFGPSLMPSGDKNAWSRLEPVLEAISAKVDPETGLPNARNSYTEALPTGEPCVTYIGPAGAGHYVKMVHNGIEYADMQLICEAYQYMREALGLQPKEIAAVLREWNKGELNSYLIEISAEVLDQDDPETGKPIVDIILDRAGQKGTGLWTAVSSLQVGSAATTIAQSVFCRALSSIKDERVAASKIFSKAPALNLSEDEKKAQIKQLHDALYCAKMCAYAQGFDLMKRAAKEQGWDLDFAEIAKIWRAGCIIRAVFLQSITKAYQRDAQLENLLLDEFFAEQIKQFEPAWREAVINSIKAGITMPTITSSLSYFDAYRNATLPANLLQGQRDFFGAHTFQRVDKPTEETYHLEWSQADRPLVRIQ
ncbi:phosphogluconate dehydrogenase (NADP(+)-dependent, decarboxylating) [Saccharobesus litoralis]|uniref:6-phosphogluconate dehydrogenase, decarboxylating n=1 Tax=Saccharobesus litoralis TaxID=2172099 RepID=A0A2S0VUC1_9ALTE|nr:NADP-dependent phosphogluconate dehydrogenase [Saccharobesus litoralis]AWB67690.1 phosphogluconate dehydrogenase (NADP(+)-dependent, decarboxylating) [Saccharobesus litoralis]